MMRRGHRGGAQWPTPSPRLRPASKLGPMSPKLGAWLRSRDMLWVFARWGTSPRPAQARGVCTSSPMRIRMPNCVWGQQSRACWPATRRAPTPSGARACFGDLSGPAGPQQRQGGGEAATQRAGCRASPERRPNGAAAALRERRESGTLSAHKRHRMGMMAPAGRS